MATHSSILAWEIPWTEQSLAGYSPWGHKELEMTEHTHTQLFLVIHGGIVSRTPKDTKIHGCSSPLYKIV